MFERKLVGLAPAARLGYIRIIAVFTALLYVLWEDFANLSQVPFDWYRPIGFMMFIPQGFMAMLLGSATWLGVFKLALVLSLLLSLIGLGTRVALLVSTVLYFVFIGTVRGYAWFFHTGLMPWYLMFFLMWLPCGDGVSVDQLLRKPEDRFDRSERTTAFAWDVFLLRAILALAYFQAGYAKLHNTGWSWLESWNLKRYVVEDSLTSMHFNFGAGLQLIHLPDFVWAILSHAALWSELLFPIVLFSWHIRMIYPLIAIGLHTSIFFMHNILFPDLIILQLIFYDWDRIIAWARETQQDRRKALFRLGCKG